MTKIEGDFLGGEQLGKLQEEEHDEEEPATEQRRECTDLRLIWAREKSKSLAVTQPWPWRLTKRVDKRRCRPGDLRHFCELQ